VKRGERAKEERTKAGEDQEQQVGKQKNQILKGKKKMKSIPVSQ